METLKPNYNNVDLSDVELVDAETMFFENNTMLLDVSLCNILPDTYAIALLANIQVVSLPAQVLFKMDFIIHIFL